MSKKVIEMEPENSRMLNIGLQGFLQAATRANYSEDEIIAMGMVALVKSDKTTYEKLEAGSQVFAQTYPTLTEAGNIINIARRLNEEVEYRSRMEREYEKFMQG